VVIISAGSLLDNCIHHIATDPGRIPPQLTGHIVYLFTGMIKS